MGGSAGEGAVAGTCRDDGLHGGKGAGKVSKEEGCLPDGGSEECCDGSCSTSYEEYGQTGCGAGQHQDGSRSTCPGAHVYSDGSSSKCSKCSDCPPGRSKTAPGCSFSEVCDITDDTDCPLGHWCPVEDDTSHPCPLGKHGRADGLLGQSTEEGACPGTCRADGLHGGKEAGKVSKEEA